MRHRFETSENATYAAPCRPSTTRGRRYFTTPHHWAICTGSRTAYAPFAHANQARSPRELSRLAIFADDAQRARGLKCRTSLHLSVRLEPWR